MGHRGIRLQKYLIACYTGRMTSISLCWSTTAQTFTNAPLVGIQNAPPSLLYDRQFHLLKSAHASLRTVAIARHHINCDHVEGGELLPAWHAQQTQAVHQHCHL